MPVKSTEDARRWLRFFGLSVEDIPRARQPAQQTADLRAEWNAEEYIVEAKIREPHEDWVKLCRDAEAEDIASTIREMRLGTLSGKIRNAYGQLMATLCAPNAFHVFWFLAESDYQFVESCLQRQLLGLVALVTYSASDKIEVSTVRHCFHYEYNDFERCPGLDAAVVSTPDGVNLYLNFYSENRARFRLGAAHELSCHLDLSMIKGLRAPKYRGRGDCRSEVLGDRAFARRTGSSIVGSSRVSGDWIWR